jgi:hypothetical protein
MKSIGLLFTLFYTFVSFGQAKIDYSAIDSPISKIPYSATLTTTAIPNFTS